MDIGNIGNKILSPIEKNSGLIGSGLGVWHEVSNGSLQSSISNLLGGQIHAPDFSEILAQLRTDPAYTNSVLALLIGSLAKDSGIGTLSRIGSIAEKAAGAYLMARGGLLVLHSATHSEYKAPLFGKGNDKTGTENPFKGAYA